MKSVPLFRTRARLGALILAAGLSLSALLTFSELGAEAKVKVGKLPKESVARHQVTALDGRQFSLAALRGQVVVLEFFAVWCSHSRDRVPALLSLGESDRERGLQIIGLAVQDEKTSAERLLQFIKDQKVDYPVALVSERVFASYIDSRDLGVPQTLVYGRDGRLAGYFLGQSAEVDAALVATVRRELEKK
jgi:thiol-disulfide isomerase/thioredoxin